MGFGVLAILKVKWGKSIWGKTNDTNKDETTAQI
jgi:hypothetical protein|tara:strand:+ start:732 stop:833 length:102 start_codon:yes stop_codon:yes gene_type:complete